MLLRPRDGSAYYDNGEEIFVKGDDIIKLPDGALTTMYHYLKNSKL